MGSTTKSFIKIIKIPYCKWQLRHLAKEIWDIKDISFSDTRLDHLTCFCKWRMGRSDTCWLQTNGLKKSGTLHHPSHTSVSTMRRVCLSAPLVPEQGYIQTTSEPSQQPGAKLIQSQLLPATYQWSPSETLDWKQRLKNKCCY